MGKPAFDFITDEDFRGVLAADYREMEICIEHGAWKAVHVLAGSIIEAVLVDYLVGTGQTKPDPLQMSLGDLIGACKKAGVLSQKTAELSGALKEYRNLIHAGRQKRLNETIDLDGAIVAQSLVSIIVKEVSAKQQESYGLTAEQIVTKFESDPSALGIAEHLLKEAPSQEIERLLLKVLPEHYFYELQGEFPSESILDGHSKLFRAAFRMASKTVKKKVLNRYVTVLKEEPGPRVQVYEEEFFRAPDLEYLGVADRKLVKAHLFARIGSEPNRKLLTAAEGIGSWLEVGDVKDFVDPLARAVAQTRDPNLAGQARSLFEGEALLTPEGVDAKLINRLDRWINAYQGRPAAETLTEIKEAYEVYQDIPF